MTEQLIEMDTIENLLESNQTIWDIENAEKLQLIAFIEEKIEQKYSKKFEYYEQLLLSLQDEYTNKLSKVIKELKYTKTKLEETTQHLCYLQDELKESNKDFILIGWGGDYDSPIIVPKNVTWSHYEIGNPYDIGLVGLLRSFASIGGKRLYIILSQLYKLPNIRNLDLYKDLLQVPNTLLIDKYFKIILKGIGYTSKSLNNEETILDEETILEIERSYPGLLKDE